MKQKCEESRISDTDYWHTSEILPPFGRQNDEPLLDTAMVHQLVIASETQASPGSALPSYPAPYLYPVEAAFAPTVRGLRRSSLRKHRQQRATSPSDRERDLARVVHLDSELREGEL